jgi:hypothetical protein
MDCYTEDTKNEGGKYILVYIKLMCNGSETSNMVWLITLLMTGPAAR